MTSPVPLPDDLTLHTTWNRNACQALRHHLTAPHTSEVSARIWPARLWDRLAIQLGGRDVQTADDTFNEKFRVDSAQVCEIQALLTSDVRDKLRLLLQQQPTFQLDLSPDGFTLEWPAQSRYRDETVAAFVALLRTLVQQDTLDWHNAAAQRGLHHAGWTISGRLHGVRITAGIVEHLWREVTEITVPTPAGFTARHPDQRRWRLTRPLSTGNPVLDSAVVIDGPPAAAARLHDPELAVALLEVVHRWPGSTVSDDGIRLRTDGRMTDELGEALDAAARLGSLLARPST